MDTSWRDGLVLPRSIPRGNDAVAELHKQPSNDFSSLLSLQRAAQAIHLVDASSSGPSESLFSEPVVDDIAHSELGWSKRESARLPPSSGQLTVNPATYDAPYESPHDTGLPSMSGFFPPSPVAGAPAPEEREVNPAADPTKKKAKKPRTTLPFTFKDVFKRFFVSRDRGTTVRRAKSKEEFVRETSKASSASGFGARGTAAQTF